MYTLPVPSDFLQQQSWVLCNKRYNLQQLEANFQAVNGQKKKENRILYYDSCICVATVLWENLCKNQ